MSIKREVIDRRLEAFDISPNKYRREVLTYLEETNCHPTAAEIFTQLKKKFPYMSQATVYNTLHLFKTKGLILALQPEGKAVHYDATTSDHCHFVCEVCGKLLDMHECTVFNTNPTGRRIQNHLINRVVAYFFGICADCQANGNLLEQEEISG